MVRKLALGLSLTISMAFLPAAAVAEDELDAAIAAGAPAPPADWTMPRTAWGDPDLRGTWPVDSVGQTPTERPGTSAPRPT